MHIICPNCKAEYNVNASLLKNTSKVRCKKCGNLWEIGIPNDIPKDKDRETGNNTIKTTQPLPQNNDTTSLTNDTVSTDPIINDEASDTELNARIEAMIGEQLFSAPSTSENLETPKEISEDQGKEEQQATPQEESNDEESNNEGKDTFINQVLSPEEISTTQEQEEISTKTEIATETGTETDTNPDTANLIQETFSTDEIIQADESNNQIPESIMNFQISPTQELTKEPLSTSEIIKRSVIIVFVLSILSGLWFGRFVIASTIPLIGNIYEAIGINVIIPGAGLEFRNISQRLVIIDDINTLEIKGSIFNTTDESITVPSIRATLYDEGGFAIQEKTETLKTLPLAAGQTIPFTVRIQSPSVVAKNIEVTFTETK